MSTATTAPDRATAHHTSGRSRSGLAIFRRAFRQIRVGAIVCGIAFGAVAASSALSYASSFGTPASRHQLVLTTSTDRGLAVLLGPVSAVGTVGGYTVYKGFVFLTTIAAVWAILAATRVLRGEEDAGRWQLVLAARTSAARATAATLGALAAAVGVVFVGTALLTLLAGRNPDVGFGVGGSLLYGVTIAAPAAIFAAVGALTSQLCRSRRTANGVALGVLAVAFVLRMVGDAGSGTQWFRWTTPFGWLELVQPFTKNDLAPLIPVVVTIAVVGGAAVLLASRRDAGAGVFGSHDVSHLRPFGLGSPFGLTVRLEGPALAIWCAGAGIAGIVFGVIAKLTTSKLPTSLGDALRGFDVHGSLADQYFGTVFLFVAAIVALLPAGQIAGAAEEETSGRLAHLLAAPVSRRAWFAGRLVLSGVAITLAGLLAGVGAWLGAESQGVHLELGRLVGAGLNVVPTALLVLGLGAVVLSVAPRAAATSVYVVVAWSLIIDLVAALVSGVSWLRDLSLFHYLALYPAQSPSGVTIAVTVAIAVGLSAGATVIFQRRDVPTA